MATTTNTLVANVAVSGACYTLALPSTITFGNSITPPYTTFTNVAVTDNDVGGNLASYIQVKGAGWAGPNTIAVGSTLWSAASEGSYTGTALTTSLANTAILIPAPSLTTSTTSNNIYFGMNVPGGLPAGTYTQAITFNNLCGTPSAASVVTANFVVAGVCYTSLSVTAITFGTMSPGTTYNTNVVVVDHDVGGNVQATLAVSGGDPGVTSGNWISGGNNFYVTNTMWSATSLGSYAGNALTEGFVSTGIIIPQPTVGSPDATNSIYFGVSVPGGTPVGTYTQNIVIQNAC
jgi:hypothetical protein